MACQLVILSLGTNMGDRFGHLQSAINEISEFVDITDVSSVYETPPFEMEANQDFYNLCLIGKTVLEPEVLLKKLNEIEKNHGRVRIQGALGYSSRPLDIDIIFYGDQLFSSEILTIPHPQFHKRNFVLLPLNEIVPDFIDPKSNLSISELAAESEDESAIKRIDKRITLNK